MAHVLPRYIVGLASSMIRLWPGAIGRYDGTTLQHDVAETV